MDIRKIAYYLQCIVAIIVLAFSVFINVKEIYDQILGRSTVFGQISIMTDRQIIIYCSVWVLIFFGLLGFLLHGMNKQKMKRAVVISVVIILAVVLMLFTDSLSHISV